jgi:GH24 family phage-related lysozyme (muramidase)
MAELSRQFLMSGPASLAQGMSTSDISAGAISELTKAIDKLSDNRTSELSKVVDLLKGDKANTQKVVEILTTLREDFRQAARDPSQKGISPELQKQLAEALVALKNIGELKELVTQLKKFGSSAWSQASTGQGGVGIGVTTAATAIDPGLGLVVKAMQENYHLIRDTANVFKEGIKLMIDIGKFFSPHSMPRRGFMGAGVEEGGGGGLGNAIGDLMLLALGSEAFKLALKGLKFGIPKVGGALTYLGLVEMIRSYADDQRKAHPEEAKKLDETLKTLGGPRPGRVFSGHNTRGVVRSRRKHYSDAENEEIQRALEENEKNIAAGKPRVLTPSELNARKRRPTRGGNPSARGSFDARQNFFGDTTRDMTRDFPISENIEDRRFIPADQQRCDIVVGYMEKQTQLLSAILKTLQGGNIGVGGGGSGFGLASLGDLSGVGGGVGSGGLGTQPGFPGSGFGAGMPRGPGGGGGGGRRGPDTSTPDTTTTPTTTIAPPAPNLSDRIKTPWGSMPTSSGVPPEGAPSLTIPWPEGQNVPGGVYQWPGSGPSAGAAIKTPWGPMPGHDVTNQPGVLPWPGSNTIATTPPTPTGITPGTPGTPIGSPGGGLVSDQLSGWIMKKEDFVSKPFNDFGQRTIGYGTSARRGETSITEPEARRRMNEQLAKHLRAINQLNPNLDQGTREALASLSYNAGEKWMSSGLGAAVKKGDIAEIKRIFVQYNKAGGKVLPGLANRRNEEVQFIGNPNYSRSSTVARPPVSATQPSATSAPVSANPAAKGGTLIVFKGLGGQVDSASVEAIAKNRGQTVKYFEYTQAKEAAEFVKNNPGPYDVIGHSAGANHSTLSEFFKNTPRNPGRLDTTGRSPKSPAFERPPGVLGGDDLDKDSHANGMKKLAREGGATASNQPAVQPPGKTDARLYDPATGAGAVTHSGTGGQMPPVLRQQMEYAGTIAGVRTDVAHGIEPGHKRHSLNAPAGDVDLYDATTGKKLDVRNPADLEKMKTYVRAAAAAGATGIGFGKDGSYMGFSRMHVGLGEPVVWGAKGRRVNAPDWLVKAWEEGRRHPMTPDQARAAIATFRQQDRTSPGVGTQPSTQPVDQGPAPGTYKWTPDPSVYPEFAKPTGTGATTRPTRHEPGFMRAQHPDQDQGESLPQAAGKGAGPQDQGESLPRAAGKGAGPLPIPYDKHHPSPEMLKDLESLRRPLLDYSWSNEGRHSASDLYEVIERDRPAMTSELLRGDHTRSDEGGAFLKDRRGASRWHKAKQALEQGNVVPGKLPTDDAAEQRRLRDIQPEYHKASMTQSPDLYGEPRPKMSDVGGAYGEDEPRSKMADVAGGAYGEHIPTPRARPVNLGVHGGGAKASDMHHGIEMLRAQHARQQHKKRRATKAPVPQHHTGKHHASHGSVPDDLALATDATSRVFS